MPCLRVCNPLSRFVLAVYPAHAQAYTDRAPVPLTLHPIMNYPRLYLSIAVLLVPAFTTAADPPVVLEGKEGPGKGKHIVLVSGDQEYRSEEAIAQLAKILATRHGFQCTVLFTVDKDTGTINPNINHIPGLEALKT